MELYTGKNGMSTTTSQQCLEMLNTAGIRERLESLPFMLSKLRSERVELARAVREAEENAANASVPLEFSANAEGKNDAQRKLLLAKARQSDKVYQAASKRLSLVQADLDMADIAIRELEERFSATKVIASLTAAELSLMAA